MPRAKPLVETSENRILHPVAVQLYQEVPLRLAVTLGDETIVLGAKDAELLSGMLPLFLKGRGPISHIQATASTQFFKGQRVTYPPPREDWPAEEIRRAEFFKLVILAAAAFAAGMIAAAACFSG